MNKEYFIVRSFFSRAVSEIENVESSCDTTQKGLFNYYVINKKESPAIIYTPENQSPSGTLECATLSDRMDFFGGGADASADLVQFDFEDSIVAEGTNSDGILFGSNNGPTLDGNVMIGGGTRFFDTPENSNGPSGFTAGRRAAHPSLPLTLFDLPQTFSEEISTPDIINCIIEGEKIDFSGGSGQPKQVKSCRAFFRTREEI